MNRPGVSSHHASAYVPLGRRRLPGRWQTVTVVRASAVVAMYATLVFGWVNLRRNRPWHVVGFAGLLLLLNVVLFVAASNVSRPWTVAALSIQVVATAAATAKIRRELLEWRSRAG